VKSTKQSRFSLRENSVFSIFRGAKDDKKKPLNAKPLRCTAFEELMLAQDSLQYPCVIVYRMHVRGKVDRIRFEKAVAMMIERHPLLRARLRTRFGRSTWDIQPTPECQVEWVSGRIDSTWTDDSYMDVRKEVGLRIFVQEQGDGAIVVIQVHHAIVDGLGLFNALHDLWLIYDALSSGATPSLTTVDAEALLTRNQFGLTWRKLLEIIPRQMIGLAGARQFVMRRPEPLVPHSLFWSERAAPLPVEVVTHRFESEVSNSLRSLAKNQKLNLNDLLAASIFTGCEQFRATSSAQSDTDWLRMMVPVSMRSTKADQQQTACNIVSAVFLDRTPVQIRDRDYLIESIHQEMELIKNNRLALMFIFSLWLGKLVLFRNRPPQPPSKCQASMVFTNLGKVYARSPLRDTEQRIVSGGLVIENVEAVAPLTPYLCAAFTAMQYAKQLSLSLRYDPRVIQRDAAESLLGRIVADVSVQAAYSSPTSATASVVTGAV